jgi:sodium transport system permease protein
MKMNNIKITIFKELRGVIRDKKALSQVVMLPIMIPLMILFIGFIYQTFDNTDYNIGINYELSNTENAIINEIGDLKLSKYESKDELDAAYKDKEISGYIIKEDNKYTIYSDSTGNSGQAISMYLTSYLEAYNKSLANDYLNSQDIDPSNVYDNVIIKTENLGDEGSNALFKTIFSMVIMYIVMIIILGSGVVATDATAGEKERGTLETILTFPVKSKELITGKYIATAIFGIVLGLFTLAITFPSILISKKLFPVMEKMKIDISIDPLTMLLLLLLIIITALLVAGISLALTGKSKSFKEAQSSLQALSFLPMIPYFLEIMEIDTSIFYFVPVANCGMALNDIIMNRVEVSSMLIIIGTTILYSAIMIYVVAKLYKSEKTLFS